ncbi:MAG: gliding motility lipoprotein GldH [Bacteroidales bacterium]|nr:gliding motility lipoprotein GldH [Bacteroidales bacterium]
MKYKVFVFIVIFSFACKNSIVFYDKYVEIPDEKWNNKNIIKFVFYNPDTVTPYNVYINIRNTNKYPLSNLYLFVTLHTPKQNILKDTINCILANDKGEWYGRTLLGYVFDNSFLYKRKYVFKEKGTYTFTLEQALRITEVLGIKNVGLKIEKAIE